MKTSAVFRIAKKRLNRVYADSLYGPQQFICNALELAAELEEISKEDCIMCQGIVQSRLEGSPTIEGWLAGKGYIPHKFANTPEVCQRIQNYRHAWVDELIREFKQKGD